MRAPWLVLCTAGAVLLGGYAALQVADLGSSSASAPKAGSSSERALGEGLARRSVAPRPRPRVERVLPETEQGPDLRPMIARVVEDEVVPRVARGTVDEYLDQLEARARAKGEVTGLEVEPGVQALIASGAGLEQLEVFTRRMEDLSAELRGEARPPAPSPRDLEPIEAELETVAAGPSRERLIQRYLEVAAGLEPEAGMEAVARLDRRIGAEAPGSPPTPDDAHS